VPVPVPLVPLVTEIQLALLAALQPHPLFVVTVVLAGPPAAATLCEVGETVYGQTPLWVTVTVWPATVSVPVRAVVEVLAATV
jgi:hypothetical protein